MAGRQQGEEDRDRGEGEDADRGGDKQQQSLAGQPDHRHANAASDHDRATGHHDANVGRDLESRLYEYERLIGEEGRGARQRQRAQKNDGYSKRPTILAPREQLFHGSRQAPLRVLLLARHDPLYLLELLYHVVLAQGPLQRPLGRR